MRQRIVWLALGMLFPVLLMADPVSKDKARQKAMEFVIGRKPAMGRGGTPQDLTLVLTNESYHVFNYGEDEGFVMVSGDDCAGDILAYSDSGSFDAQNMPENLRAWLQGYTEQIEWMKQNGVTAADMKVNSSRAAANKALWENIEPLMASKWNQGDPYNRQTPEVSGKHCPTGCVATAMAQVMYYWYKETGFEAKLEKDIPKSTKTNFILGSLKAPEFFDWANLEDRTEYYNNPDKCDAVAKLMKYCGYSVKMDYDIDESGAYTADVASALTQYFGYQSSRFIKRMDYSYEDWEWVIYTDLYNRRPVIMEGTNNKGPHEFVCDGYKNDNGNAYYHFNWGWGGKFDAYYRLSLTGYTTTGYGYNQAAVCGIHPTNEVSLPVEPMESAPANQVEVRDIVIPTLYYGETAYASMTVINHNNKKYFNNDIIIKLYDKDDDDIEEYIGVQGVNIEPEGRVELHIPVSVNVLTPGEYKMNIYCIDDYFNKYMYVLYKKTVTVYPPLPNLDGTVMISENHAEPGVPVTFKLSGAVAELPSSDINVQWRRKRRDVEMWEILNGATGSSYTPQWSDVDKYLSVQISATGYHGSLVSNRIEVEKPMLEGMVTYVNTSNTIPGNRLTYYLSGKVKDIDAGSVHAQWQRSVDGQYLWNDLSGETGQSYELKASDVGYYLRVKITATNYNGMLYSSPRLCKKRVCTQNVVEPILENSTYYNQVCVTNPVSTQEYIILNTNKDVANLTENDWKNAKTPNTSYPTLPMGGTVNAINYVYTRVKETETTSPSEDVGMNSIYFGENVYTQDIKLTLKEVGYGSAWEKDLQKGAWNHYYTQVDHIIRIEVDPVPSNATNFNGIYYSRWINNSQNGTFYSDDKCTKPLESGKSYRKAYFRPAKQQNYLQIFVEYQRGYNDVAAQWFYLDVADASGNYLINSIQATIDLYKGEKASDKVQIDPGKAKLDGVTLMLNSSSSTGTAPVVTIEPWWGGVSVDATNATKGNFYYDVYKDGTKLQGYVTVHITTPVLEEIRLLPSELELDCGQSMQLTAQLFPAGVDESVTWSSSNPNVATVTSTGVVRVNDDANIGAKTIIIAKAGSLTATCQVTVPGEKYNIFLAGTQVTSRNMNDLTKIEGVGAYGGSNDTAASFDGKTLYLRNVMIDGGKYGMVLGVEDMTVVVDGGCWLENFRHGIMLNRSATITGNGYVCIYGTPNENSLNGIVFRDNVDYPICLTLKNIELASIGNQHGVLGFDHHHSIKLDNVSASVFGLEGAMINVKGGIMLNNCYTDSWYSITDGSVTDGNGDPAPGIVHFYRFKSGDVNNDKKYDISDAITLINYLSGKEVEQILLPAADANKDGQVNERDLPVVLRRISGVRDYYYK